ncbi:hypothetical protein K431DRAFT_280774 [Polychaeton citri CBS 116435]|uniref:Uncharacterized protein n=1 Tax=Polychaeton citri CBS 116435 TaxID=1314669 RepID=A0A9P4USV5_9PEZI|nr:hypothetical protein K431DRAFT_280774 [Polychaeton citri CBS 116435]
MFGWPVLVHHCDECGYNTSVSYSPNVWTENHVCSHCSHNSPGADIEGHSKANMNATQHDELAQLFAQQMSFSPTAHLQQQANAAPAPAATASKLGLVQQQPPTVHYASAHYTQTPHVRADPHFDTYSPPSPPPPYTPFSLPQELMETFQRHDIDPSSLLPAQVELFTSASYEQKLRLLELWRISPPIYPLQDHQQQQQQGTSWKVASLETEEAEARQRYEDMMRKREQQGQQTRPQDSPMQMQSQPSFAEEPVSPIRGPGEPAWPPAARMRSALIASRQPAQLSAPGQYAEAEPYIVQGFARSSNISHQATDPVYMGTASEWQGGSSGGHGDIEQVRCHADWERLNEHTARSGFGNVMMQSGGLDEEMEL